MRVIEPALQGDFYGGYYTDSDSTGDIHKFTSGLADACARLGVACRYGQEVTALAREHGKVRVGMGADSTLFDAVVVCAGTASRAMAASLGDHVNVYPVKGYSITVQLDDAASRAAAPSVSLLDDATKLVSSRLGEDRLRVAGTAEFNGIDYDIRADRIRPLVRWVEQCFPGIKTRQVIPWAGLRPMLPAMLPKVGPGRHPACITTRAMATGLDPGGRDGRDGGAAGGGRGAGLNHARHRHPHLSRRAGARRQRPHGRVCRSEQFPAVGPAVHDRRAGHAGGIAALLERFMHGRAPPLCAGADTYDLLLVAGGPGLPAQPRDDALSTWLLAAAGRAAPRFHLQRRVFAGPCRLARW
jgi:hypothetical protein